MSKITFNISADNKPLTQLHGKDYESVEPDIEALRQEYPNQSITVEYQGKKIEHMSINAEDAIMFQVYQELKVSEEDDDEEELLV